MTYDEIMAVYRGSDGEATRRLYALLETFAPRGVVAMNLLRTCKASERAKQYRGRRGRGQPSYRALAYDKKDWAMWELVRAMVLDPDVVPSWGWGRDEKAVGFENVLYVDVPGAGQVSFHAEHRKDGPDYAGAWDGTHGVAPRRICLWTEAVLQGREVVDQPANEGEKNVAAARTEGAAASSLQGGQGEPEQKALDL